MSILENKIAIVTGAGQGVGRGIAIALAKEGAAIAIPEINFERAVMTADEITSFGGRALAIPCDVCDRAQVNAAVAKTIGAFGTVDILVNNAQNAHPGVPIEQETDDGWHLTFQSGIHATFYFMQACFPYMKDRGGRIMNLASMAGLSGVTGMSAYAANKEAIRGLSRVAANEWGQYNINVNVIIPWSSAPSWEQFQKEFPDVASASIAQNPMRRVGDSEKDVGRVAVFLAGPDSTYVNGLNIPVDGGMAVLR